MVLIPIGTQQCVKVTLLKKPLWGSHADDNLHPTQQDLGNPAKGCGEVDRMELQEQNVLDSILCFILAKGELVDAEEVGTRSNEGGAQNLVTS